MTKLTGNAIKKYLREQGFDTKKISASVSYPGYETSICIIVKDKNLNAVAIEREIKNKFGYIRRDEINGEILQGANVFVECRYDYDLLEEVIENKMIELEELYEFIRREFDGAGIEVFSNDNFKVLASVDSLDNISLYIKAVEENAIRPTHIQTSYTASTLYEFAEALFYIEKEDVIFTEFIA